MVWVQGESEGTIPADSTYRNMRRLIDTLRAIRSGLPRLVAIDRAREAQLRLAAEGVVVRGPDIDSLRLTPHYFQSDLAEFSGPGFQAHANAWLSLVRETCR